MTTIAVIDAARIVRDELLHTLKRVAPSASSGAIEQVVTGVIAAYQENHRDYHDIRHPAQMLLMYETLRGAHQVIDHTYDHDLMVLLIVFHDVIIKVGRESGWNEKVSAEYAVNALGALDVNDKLIRYVSCGILASAQHRLASSALILPENVFETILLFLDIDLAGLGQSAAGFADDTERVWHEFRAHLERKVYDEGRAAWAARFLERPFTYHTEFFEAYEARAIKNLRALAMQR